MAVLKSTLISKHACMMLSVLYKLFLICLFTCYVRSQEEECTLDGFKGRCVELKRCMFVIQVFHQGDKPQMCHSKGGVQYVCCTDCKLVDDNNKIAVDPQRGLLYYDGRGKSWDYCLDQLKIQPYDCKNHYFYTLMKDWNEKQQCHDVRYTVVGASGGVDAKRLEVPHAALLGYGTEESGIQWFCGGTLIHERFILTAGHCISNPVLGPVTTAALGLLKMSDPEALKQKHRIQDNIKHPDYNPPSKYNDIALLKTATRVRFNEHVLPACLPNHRTRDHDFANAVGWGAVGSYREVADTLQKETVTRFTGEECSTLYEPTRVMKQGINTSTQHCWGSRNSIQDTCQHDIGGPLYAASGCQDEVLGVASFGRMCAFHSQPVVYTRVAHYVPWIESVAWP